jgi:diguanylate cyclase (GGDEF)-like protein
VLRCVADVLAQHVRGSDVAARLGGAQFGLLLDQSTEDTARVTATRVLDLASAALGATATPDVSVSLGVACFDDASFPPESMIDHADAAMYCAKAQGRNRMFVTRLAATRTGAAHELAPPEGGASRAQGTAVSG